MRLLFLDMNLRYMNPTRALVPAMLREAAETVLYGPGYQPLQVLERGVEAFYAENGPFDFVIGNDFSVLVYRQVADDLSRMRHYRLEFDERAVAAMRDVGGWFLRYRGRKVTLLLECDAFNVTTAHIDTLNAVGGCYAVQWDRWLMESVADSDDLAHEPYAGKANDNFFDFVTRNETRIIAMPHFVADGEFAWSPLAERDSVWTVPGAADHYRTQARQTLERDGLLRKHFPWMRAFALMTKAGVRPYANPLLLSLYNAQFTRGIERSRYAYTCGSAQRMQIRKHFEIPALGALLVTAPVNGLERMGFRDGENCFVRAPQGLSALHRELERDLDHAQAVASAGRELIWTRHRIASRAGQFRACLDAIAEDAFAGSIWQDGCWSVRRTVAAAAH